MGYRVLVAGAVAALVFAGSAGHADPPPSLPGMPAMPDDVRAIMERSQRGIPPSPADAARLQAWARGMAAATPAIKKSAEAARAAAPAADPSLPKRNGDTRIHGSLRVEVHQHTRDDDGRRKQDTDVDGVFSVPVIYRVRNDVPPTRPDGKPPIVIAFEIDAAAPPARAPRGGVRSFTVVRSGGNRVETTVEASVQATMPSAVRGELFADAARARPYLKLDAALIGALHVVEERIEGNDRKRSVNDGQGALPMAPVTMDGFAAPVPFEGSIAGNPALRDKLPKEVRDAVDKATFTIDAAALRKGLDAGKPFRTVGTFSYHLVQEHSALDAGATLTFAIEPPPSDLVIAPTNEKAWRKWLPLPWELSAEDAKIFELQPHDPSVAIELAAGYDNKASGKKCQLDLDLREVSEGRGLTTNYPVDAGTNKGLRILPDQAGLVVDGNGQHARTKDKVQSVKFKVAAMETGAWGHVEARCDERSERATFAATGRTFVGLPRDDDENHVADAFEEDNAMLHKPGNYDEDSRPQYQRRLGDGYTLYEEYRGFVVREDQGSEKRTFVRTDPRNKDIFVYDRDGIIKKYYEPNNAVAANLTLHYVDPKLMHYDKARETSGLKSAPPPDHRQMNANTPPELRYARQFAVVAVNDKQLSEDGACYDGEAMVIPKPPDNSPEWVKITNNPLRSYEIIRVNLDCSAMRITTIAAGLGVPANDPVMNSVRYNWVMNSVVHEFGHQIGISHHFARPGIEYDPSYHQEWEWGPPSCAMRYARNFLDAALLKNKKFPAHVRYCRDRERGQYPLHGNVGKPVEDSEPRTCFEQITLKGDP